MYVIEIGDKLDWIFKNTEESTESKSCFVSHFLPDRFERYIKILHTIYEDPSVLNREMTWNRMKYDSASIRNDNPIGINFKGKRIKWLDLCKRYDVSYKKTISGESFSKRFPERSYPRYLVGPDEGSLQEEEMIELIKILSPTCSDKNCYFYYECWWALRDCSAPRLYKGIISEMVNLSNNNGFSPSYFWSHLKEWCVNTDYDSTFTIIGCNNEIAKKILSSNILESIEVDRKTRIDYMADEE